MRTLILIPIAHMPADMGSAAESLRQAGMRRLGRRRWAENLRKIEKFWADVEAELGRLSLNYKKVRIYQDGLPCGGELALRIVNTAAKAGSRNFQIIRKLVGLGAIPEATEDPELLMQEYAHIKAFTAAKTRPERLAAERRYDEIKDELLHKRDAAIAAAIDRSLAEGETGILFIGAHHEIKLPADIAVKKLE